MGIRSLVLANLVPREEIDLEISEKLDAIVEWPKKLAQSRAKSDRVRLITMPHLCQANCFPRTRYQGSKRRLAGGIVRQVAELEFTTVLDAFGGTGAVAYAFKRAGKAVTYNDYLAFNHQIGLALIENDTVRLDDDVVDAVVASQLGVQYPDFIEKTFAGIYFTPAENRWLDVAVTNIRNLDGPYQRALAWFALFQAAMAKRPYNLFHRSNLYMRTADVPRGFGNKASWDRGFPEHFRRFVAEANAAVFESTHPCRAFCQDVLALEPGYDLVYIDPPYINRAGVGVHYRAFYHFLEGMFRYDQWPTLVDRRSKHRRLLPQTCPWTDAKNCHAMFRRLFHHFRDSILVVSYRSDGIPSIDGLIGLLREVKPAVEAVTADRCQYVLSTSRETKQVLLVGMDHA